MAGTSSIRTTVASRTSAMIMPMPTKRIVVTEDRANAPVTTISSRAAALITRPVRARPVVTASARGGAPGPRLDHPGQQEHLVVGGQAEHHGRHQHHDADLGRRRA